MAAAFMTGIIVDHPEDDAVGRMHHISLVLRLYAQQGMEIAVALLHGADIHAVKARKHLLGTGGNPLRNLQQTRILRLARATGKHNHYGTKQIYQRFHLHLILFSCKINEIFHMSKLIRKKCAIVRSMHSYRQIAI